ncbi:uncharacterized protein zgc:113425 isoform X5 [Nerophis ophidion]|uniref:uncharacterized protein zgc:113425 isoform X5 n=1 Tax=Nerophis ophidion TaxID=159077 RepID=UPI002ADFE9E9|nr:uncharacterized protein zgc:113425 isoform X5 [Nerophis ophidion]
MDRYKYFMFNQKNVLVLGVLQVACAALCLICGFMDAVFRKDTPLSTTRTPVWGAMIMACPAVLALFASQRKNSILVSVMVAAAVLSCVATVFVLGYACLTLTYGEEDKEVFHHHDSPEVETLVPQCDPGDAEMVCTWQAGSDDRLFNSPFQSPPDCGKTQEDLGASSKLPPYSRLS